MTGRVLVTGSTGFVGRVVTRVLAERGHPVRLLLRPSSHLTSLPVTDAETVVASLQDERGIRSAMAGVSTLVHLATAENAHRRRDLWTTDIEGTRNLLAQAKSVGVEKILYLSHLGADRGSAFPFLQAKGIAENAILESGIPSLILRSSLVFGVGDIFTNAIALITRMFPGVFFVPDLDSQLQPLWVEDLAACMEYCLAEDRYFGEILSIGGPEHLNFVQIVETVLDAVRAPRILVPVWPPLLRMLIGILDGILPHFPLTPFWLDYLSVNRICEANSLPRLFSLKPARLSEQIGYLREGRGRRQLLQFIFQGRKPFLEASSRRSMRRI